MKSKELVAGSFVLGGIIGLLGIIAVLGDFLERTDPYFTKVSNVAGLKKGAAVIYEGYIIGSVSDITPKAEDDAMSFLVSLEIKEGWKIPETSRAGIASLSLLSAMAIQIKAGDGPALSPGDEILMSEQMNFVDELSQTADNFAKIAEESLVPLLNTIDGLLSNHGATTLGNVSLLSEGLAAEVPKIAYNLNRSARNLNKLIKSIDPAMVKSAVDDVDQILGNTLEVSEGINQAVTSVNADVLKDLVTVLNEAQQATSELNAIMAASGKKVDGILDNVNQTSENANEMSRLSGDQILTILDRLDRAALNVEEMTTILKNNPGVLITGTE